MDFLKKALDSDKSDDQKKEPSTQSQHTDKTSSTELLSSAKVLAGAAQSTLRHETVDKSKVADAADDLLHGASQYGKLEEKGYGQYVEKAETYIHQYSSGKSAAPSTTTAASTESGESAKAEKEGGIGDFAKMAQGFLK